MMRFGKLVLASAFAMASFSVAPFTANAQQTHLSQCMRNGLIGAGAGAVVGALTSHHHQGRSAVLGAAVGGLGAYGICRLLTRSDERHVERSYQRSLSNNHAVSESWGSGGNAKSLYVSHPTNDGNGCRRVSATITDAQHGRQSLPPETFCRNSSGEWVPADD
jgi:hypothetical protein